MRLDWPSLRLAYYSWAQMLFSERFLKEYYSLSLSVSLSWLCLSCSFLLYKYLILLSGRQNPRTTQATKENPNKAGAKTQTIPEGTSDSTVPNQETMSTREGKKAAPISTHFWTNSLSTGINECFKSSLWKYGNEERNAHTLWLTESKWIVYSEILSSNLAYVSPHVQYWTSLRNSPCLPESPHMPY